MFLLSEILSGSFLGLERFAHDVQKIRISLTLSIKQWGPIYSLKRLQIKSQVSKVFHNIPKIFWKYKITKRF
jgi:hypothetical protein